MEIKINDVIKAVVNLPLVPNNTQLPFVKVLVCRACGEFVHKIEEGYIPPIFLEPGPTKDDSFNGLIDVKATISKAAQQTYDCNNHHKIQCESCRRDDDFHCNTENCELLRLETQFILNDKYGDDKMPETIFVNLPLYVEDSNGKLRMRRGKISMTDIVIFPSSYEKYELSQYQPKEPHVSYKLETIIFTDDKNENLTGLLRSDEKIIVYREEEEIMDMKTFQQQFGRTITLLVYQKKRKSTTHSRTNDEAITKFFMALQPEFGILYNHIQMIPFNQFLEFHANYSAQIEVVQNLSNNKCGVRRTTNLLKIACKQPNIDLCASIMDLIECLPLVRLL